jgi:hypothetical protein
VNRKVWIASVISTVVALMLASMAVAFAAQEEGGNAQEKVTICHKGHTITVAAPALAAHERHGDTEGACPAEDGAGEGGADEGQEGMVSSPAEGRDLYGDSAANTLRGTLHADFLQSGRGPDVVFGGVGNDFIDGVDGTSGNDEIDGGGGIDHCVGDEGDTFRYCDGNVVEVPSATP